MAFNFSKLPRTAQMAYFAKQAARQVSQAASGAARGVRSAARSVKGAAERTRQSPLGTVGDYVFGKAQEQGGPLARHVADAENSRELYSRYMRNVVNRLFGAAGSREIGQRIARRVRKNPVVHAGVVATSGVANVVGDVTKELFLAGAETLGKTESVAAARKYSSMATAVFGNRFREMGRSARAAKGPISKRTVKPMIEFFTGTPGVVPDPTGKSQGSLRLAGGKQTGALASIRRWITDAPPPNKIITGTESVEEAAKSASKQHSSMSNAMAKLHRYKEARKQFFGPSSPFREELKSLRNRARDYTPEQLRIEETKIRERARKRWLEHLKGKKEELGMDTIIEERTPFGRRRRRVAPDYIREALETRHRGADVNLATMAAVTGTAAYTGTQLLRSGVKQIMFERRKKAEKEVDKLLRKEIEESMRRNYPELPEYQLENLIEQRFRQRKAIQAQAENEQEWLEFLRTKERIASEQKRYAATKQASKNSLLSKFRSKPSQRKIKIIKAKPKRLRSILIGGSKKKSTKKK